MLNHFTNNCNNCNASLTGKVEFVTDNGNRIRDIVNYFKLINHTRDIVKEKLEIVLSENTNNVRNKRGIIDGLGSVLKVITGNLDAYDGKRYDNILEQMSSNQRDMTNQLEYQYSFSENIIIEYNKTFNIIEQNLMELKSKIIDVNNKINDFVALEKLRNILNQLNILYNMLLQVVIDLENSLTFCKLGVLHPSVISIKELYLEIKKIETYYDKRLPIEPKSENMWELESLIEVNCRLGVENIVYFLNLPIVEKYNFNIYKLRSVPTMYDGKYVTVIPNVNYMLVSSSVTLGLDSSCKHKIDSKYFCSFDQISHEKMDCETTIVRDNKADMCKYIALEITDNFIDFVPELNQYLATFRTKETLKLVNQEETNIITLQGIFLIKPNNNTIIYNNNKLFHMSRTKGGHPKLLEVPDLNLQEDQEPEFSVNIRKLEFDKINLNTISRINKKMAVTKNISVWTITLYGVVIGGFLYILLNKFLRTTPRMAAAQPPPEVLFREGGVM